MSIQILIVEGHDDFRTTVKRFLETQDFGAHVYQAKTMTSGMRMLRLHKPEVVLMDMEASGGNFLELAKKIHSLSPHCRIVMLSMMQVNRIQRFHEYRGLIDFVSKDDIYEKLLPSIRKMAGRVQVTEAAQSKRLGRSSSR